MGGALDFTFELLGLFYFFSDFQSRSPGDYRLQPLTLPSGVPFVPNEDENAKYKKKINLALSHLEIQ